MRPSVRRLIGVALAVVCATVALPFQAAAPAQAATAVTSDTVTPEGGCALPVSMVWRDRLANLAPHPRVVYGASDKTRMHERAIDPATKAYFGNYVSWGNSVLTRALPQYSTGSLASAASNSTANILALGFRYLGYEYVGLPYYPRDDVDTVQELMAGRITEEILAISAFPEWNQNEHFLETSYLTTAVSMGYSLAHDRLTPQQRQTVVDALVRNALAPATCLWQQNARSVYSYDNWGVITNAAMIMAALAIADEEPDLAAAALAAAQPRMNRALRVLATDGGSAEGPSYVAFLGNFTAYAMASLWHSLPDGDLAIQNVPAAARWAAAIYGPSGLPFNFADADLTLGKELLPVWNAFRGGDRLGSWLANHRLAEGKATLLYLLWLKPGGVNPAATFGRTAFFPRTGVVSLRNGFGQGDSWIALKGGNNAGGHAHRELGSYVLDLRGVRWVSDYGKDDYGLYKYFVEKTRATYFRTINTSASTVGVVGRLQPLTASAPITTPWVDSRSVARTRLDMRQAAGAVRATRDVGVSASGAVSVSDVLTTAGSQNVRWIIHTQAGVAIAADGRSAVLNRRDAGGVLRKVRLTITGSRGVLRTASPPATRDVNGKYGYSNAGFTMLVFTTATVVPRGSSTGQASISALYTPLA